MKWQDGSWARVANLMLGGWLLISAFLWHHAPAQQVDAAVVGYLIFASALAAVTHPPARFVNTALAVWLFLSTIALPVPKAGTEWNNALVAMAVFLLSLVGAREEPRLVLRVPRET